MGIGDRDARGIHDRSVVIEVSFGQRAASAAVGNAAQSYLDDPETDFDAPDIDELDMDDLPDIDREATDAFEGFELDAEPPLDVSGRVAFGVELPAGRNDMVAAIAALTQLMSIADEQGVDADSSLRAAIMTLRHSLEGASVILPPHLLELLDMIAPLEQAANPASEAPGPSSAGQPGAPKLRLVD
jgi:hypothetical protein